MRKFYSVLNMLVFCFVLYYITCKPTNQNLKHAAIVMGGIAILAAGYMAYLEYTDDSEEVRTTQINKMKESYGSKISELLNRTMDYDQKDRNLVGITEENRGLVEELSYAKKLLLKYKGQLETKKVDNSKEINSQFVIPSKRFNIDTTHKPAEKPNTDNNNTSYSDENYHFTHLPNQASVFQPTGGPPPAENTIGNEPINIEDRINDYKNFNPITPQQKPSVPDFLKPVETKPGSGMNMGGMGF